MQVATGTVVARVADEPFVLSAEDEEELPASLSEIERGDFVALEQLLETTHSNHGVHLVRGETHSERQGTRARLCRCTFGVSGATDLDPEKSDADFLVEFDDGSHPGLETYLRMRISRQASIGGVSSSMQRDPPGGRQPAKAVASTSTRKP